MKIRTFNNIEEIKIFFGFKLSGDILEKDIFVIENDTDNNDRKYHDAEIICTIAKNTYGNAIEIGTSYGRGCYKIATNINGIVYTVNALPDQISGGAITHALSKEEIGSYLVKMKINNFIQFYENSIKWNIPNEVENIRMIFIDGCHDSNFVYLDSLKTYQKLQNGGFILWHDFNPNLVNRYSWIQSAMSGVEKFCSYYNIKEVYHLKNSWIGFYKNLK